MGDREREAADDASRAPSPETLPALLVAARRGDAGAWNALVGMYGRRLFALAKSRCGRADEAEEVTQSVLVTVARTLRESGDGYEEQGKFESWLFRIAMNRIRDHARRTKRQARTSDPDVLDGREARRAEDTRPDERVLRRLRTAMEELGDADREIIELRHHGQLDFKTMAEMLGEPLGTLLARHHRALKKLKAMLEHEDEGSDERTASERGA